MHHRPSLLLVYLIVACLSCSALAAAQKAPAKVAPTKTAPRGVVLEWQSKAGQPYWYRVPKKISAASPPNLLFMFHGTGGRHYWSFANYPIAAGKFRGDDIVVSPEGVTPGQGDTFNFVQNANDGAQIVGLIKVFKKAFPIGKVYLYGHSQGAFFCYWFAGEHPELVDGFVAHAGNVLSVKHSKLAKSKIAVGILHARSDQVVAVECATRSAKIYRDQGYQKLKLEIVENIRPQAGHWPLPQHVSKMFEWVDLVSRDDPGQTLAGAERELGKKAPDLGVVVDAVNRAKKLLKQAKRDAPERARLADLAGLIDTLAEAHAAAILADRKAQGDKGIQPWTAHYRHAARALGGAQRWQKAARSLIAKAKPQDKSLGRALRKLRQKWNAKTAAQAVRSLQKNPLAVDADELLGAIARYVEKGDAPINAKSKAALDEYTTAAKNATETAVKRADAIDEEHVAAFRKAHPDRFPAPAKTKS